MSAGTTIPGNEWHAVCGSFELKKGSKAYIDGELAAEAPDNGLGPCDGTASVFLAHREDGQFLNAVIDEVRIWPYIVDPKTLKTSMSAPLGGQAVDGKNHLATTWGTIKELY